MSRKSTSFPRKPVVSGFPRNLSFLGGRPQKLALTLPAGGRSGAPARSLGGGSGTRNWVVLLPALFPWADAAFAAGGLAARPWAAWGCGGPGTTKGTCPLRAPEGGVPSRQLEPRWHVLSGRRFRGPWSVTITAWTMGVGRGLGDPLSRVTHRVLPALPASWGRDVAWGCASGVPQGGDVHSASMAAQSCGMAPPRKVWGARLM